MHARSTRAHAQHTHTLKKQHAHTHTPTHKHTHTLSQAWRSLQHHLHLKHGLRTKQIDNQIVAMEGSDPAAVKEMYDNLGQEPIIMAYPTTSSSRPSSAGTTAGQVSRSASVSLNLARSGTEESNNSRHTTAASSHSASPDIPEEEEAEEQHEPSQSRNVRSGSSGDLADIKLEGMFPPLSLPAFFCLSVFVSPAQCMCM